MTNPESYSVISSLGFTKLEYSEGKYFYHNLHFRYNKIVAIPEIITEYQALRLIEKSERLINKYN